MAVYLPQASGLWSTTTWITAIAFTNLTAFAGNNTLPTFVDDVYADGKTITIDINTGVSTITTIATPITGGLAGGGFRINNTISLSANIIAGTTTCLTFLSATPNTCTVFGNITGSSSTASNSVLNSSSGTLNIYGDLRGGLGTRDRFGVINSSNGVINLFGEARSGFSQETQAIRNSSSGIVNIVGNVVGVGSVTPGAQNDGSGLLTVVGYISSNSQDGRGLINVSTGTVNVTGNIYGGPRNYSPGIINSGPGTINVLGSLFGNSASTGGQSHGITNNSSGIINISGDVYGGGWGDSYGVLNNSTGIVSVTGNVYAGVGGQPSTGLRNASNGTFIIYGDAIGRTGSTNAVYNNLGNVYLYGNANGGSAANTSCVANVGNGYILITKNVIGGTGSAHYGAVNNATGYMEISGIAIGNGWGLGSAGIGGASPGIFGSQTGTTIIRGLSCGPRGQWPTGGNVFIVPQNTSTATLFTSASAAQVLFTSLSTNIVPPASSVRLGTRYNLNDYTGTCGMPSISSVLQGVSVDNSIGIAALQPQTIWNYSTLSATDVNSLGGRLANVATVQSIGQQLTALNL